MPREIVSNVAPGMHQKVTAEQWVDRYYKADNYTSTRIAVIERTGTRNRDDFTYRVESIGDNFREARIHHTYRSTKSVILLGLPTVVDQTTSWLKLHDDQVFCNSRSGTESDPLWCHCVHADYSRVGDFIFSATKPLEDFELQLGVAISVLETMRFYSDRVAEVKALSRKVFDLPQVSDSMQKYIASIVLGDDYTPVELLTMVQTVITRNLRRNADLLSTAAMLILLPMVKQLFSDPNEDSISRQSAVPRIHQEYKAKLASLDLSSASQSDNWIAAKQAKSSWGDANSTWVGAVCLLALNFGVTETLVQSLRRELRGISAGKAVFSFKLPNEDVPWIRNRSDEMRIVKQTPTTTGGARAAGLSIHTRCSLTLSPSGTQSYSVVLVPLSQGGGAVSLSSELEKWTTKCMLTTVPIHIEMDHRINACVIKQGNVEFTLQGRRLNIQFRGGFLTMTPVHRTRTGKGCCDANEVCGICLLDTEPSHIKYVTDCKHTFHKHCIDQWINHCTTKPTCPMCRRGI